MYAGNVVIDEAACYFFFFFFFGHLERGYPVDCHIFGGSEWIVHRLEMSGIITEFTNEYQKLMHSGMDQRMLFKLRHFS